MNRDLNTLAQYDPQAYWEERLSKHFSLRATGHLTFGHEYNAWLYRSKVHVLTKLLKEKNILCSGMKLLDIGVGTGFYVKYWEKLGVKSLTGIDITARSIAELKKRYPNHRFIRANIGDTKIPINEKFDIITAFDVLFHMISDDEFEQAIKNIRNLSHANTIILITDNFLKAYKPPRSHENDRTLKYYKSVLTANSLEIDDIKPIFYLMNTPIDRERINGELAKILTKAMWWVTLKIMGYAKHLGILGRGITYFWGLALYCGDRMILKCTSAGPGMKLLLAKPMCPHKDIL